MPTFKKSCVTIDSDSFYWCANDGDPDSPSLSATRLADGAIEFEVSRVVYRTRLAENAAAASAHRAAELDVGAASILAEWLAGEVSP